MCTLKKPPVALFFSSDIYLIAVLDCGNVRRYKLPTNAYEQLEVDQPIHSALQLDEKRCIHKGLILLQAQNGDLIVIDAVNLEIVKVLARGKNKIGEDYKPQLPMQALNTTYQHFTFITYNISQQVVNELTIPCLLHMTHIMQNKQKATRWISYMPLNVDSISAKYYIQTTVTQPLFRKLYPRTCFIIGLDKYGYYAAQPNEQRMMFFLHSDSQPDLYATSGVLNLDYQCIRRIPAPYLSTEPNAEYGISIMPENGDVNLVKMTYHESNENGERNLKFSIVRVLGRIEKFSQIMSFEVVHDDNMQKLYIIVAIEESLPGWVANRRVDLLQFNY
ncbi:hypothetical protein FGO68_gene13537 [Halteria grandinella]|uniref:Uncharacterized protein n=1 Tax=Halteria grandinella TaxID=5974 RepID=A0A8J8NRB6_HALGN|nr:hypothetical protein FGO68_gene13537 [Halteria grandinella]